MARDTALRSFHTVCTAPGAGAIRWAECEPVGPASCRPTRVGATSVPGPTPPRSKRRSLLPHAPPVMVPAFFLSVRKRFCVKREAGGALFWSHPGTAPATVNDRPLGRRLQQPLGSFPGRRSRQGHESGDRPTRSDWCCGGRHRQAPSPYSALVILPSSKGSIF